MIDAWDMLSEETFEAAWTLYQNEEEWKWDEDPETLFPFLVASLCAMDNSPHPRTPLPFQLFESTSQGKTTEFHSIRLPPSRSVLLLSRAIPWRFGLL
jgi:hypothetical protein